MSYFSSNAVDNTRQLTIHVQTEDDNFFCERITISYSNFRLQQDLDSFVGGTERERDVREEGKEREGE